MAQWSWGGTALGPLSVGGGLWGLPAAPGTQQGSHSALQCQGHPGPLRAIHSVATLALLIDRGLHPPKTPLLPWGCGILGWAPEGSLCPAAGGMGESLARYRSPGTLGEGRGAPSRDQTSVEARGVQACPRTSVCRHVCVPGLGHMCCTRGLGSRPGFTPTPRGASCPPLHLGTFS